MVVATESPTPWSALDLRWVFDTALERGGHLLTAGELHVVQVLRGLPDGVLDTYARLSTRKHAVHRREDAEPHAEALIEAGALGSFVPWSLRARRSTVEELKAGLSTMKLRRGGRRDALVERLAPHTGWSDQRWVRVRHRGLLRRLEQWAFLRAHPDRSTLVVERLGHVAWPAYTRTPGTALFASRARLLAWESQLHSESPEARLSGLEHGHTRGPARLDRSRSAARHVLHEAREIEREGDLERAARLYERLAAVSPRYRSRALVRLARTYELRDQPRAALQLLQAHRAEATGADRLAVCRAGRRLARSLRTGWAPDRPLARPRERTLRLRPHESDASRPRWRDGAFIEAAVVDLLASQGRTAMHCEGSLWRTLFALLFAPSCYFLPVPGQLPVRRLSGPLDLGTPGFAARREEAVQAVRDRIRAGEASQLVAEAYSRFEGQRLAGCTWQSSEHHRSLVEAIGPELLLGVLDPLIHRGFRASSGLPDLLVMPGPEVRLPRGIPGRVGTSLRLVEIKGPTDTLSDAQRCWLDRLAPIAPAEVWKVRTARCG